MQKKIKIMVTYESHNQKGMQFTIGSCKYAWSQISLPKYPMDLADEAKGLIIILSTLELQCSNDMGKNPTEGRTKTIVS